MEGGFDVSDTVTGFGRMLKYHVTPMRSYASIIYDGQFYKGQLNGFGRIIDAEKNYNFIGYFMKG